MKSGQKNQNTAGTAVDGGKNTEAAPSGSSHDADGWTCWRYDGTRGIWRDSVAQSLCQSIRAEYYPRAAHPSSPMETLAPDSGALVR